MPQPVGTKRPKLTKAKILNRTFLLYLSSPLLQTCSDRLHDILLFIHPVREGEGCPGRSKGMDTVLAKVRQ